MLRQFLKIAVSVSFCLWVAQGRTASAAVTVTIDKPAADGFTEDPLDVSVTVTSTYEIQSVTAKVGESSAELSYSSSTSSWTGKITLSGLARGSHTLVVTALDLLGNSAQATRTFVYDQKPRITIRSPLDGTVARPSLRVAITCTDDDPAGSCSIVVAEKKVLKGGKILVTGGSKLDTILSMSEYEGQEVPLDIYSRDSAGQETHQYSSVFVESSARLRILEQVPGSQVLDFDDKRILYGSDVATYGDVVIFDRIARTSEKIAKEVVSTGFLTAKGAMFQAENGVYEWREHALSPINLGGKLMVKGDFAVWTKYSWTTYSSIVYRRDLKAGTDVTVTEEAFHVADVAANGDVVFTRAYAANRPYYDVWRYRDGLLTTLTSKQSYDPVTDGTNVIYGQTDGRIARYDAFADEVLAEATYSFDGFPARTKYNAADGWCFFQRKSASGVQQLWRRSPSGQITQVTFFGSGSTIAGSNPDGDLMFANGSSLYLSKGGQEPVKIGSKLLKPRWVNGEWLAMLGNSIFEIDTAPYPSISLSSDKAAYTSGETVTLTRFRIANPDAAAAAVEAKVWLDMPNVAPITILNLGADGSFALPGNFDSDLGPLSLFAVGGSTPQGSYEFGARVLRPTTAELLSEDILSFTVGSPTAGSADPDFKPSLLLTLDKSTYGSGETVTASALRLRNSGSSSGTVELKLWLSQPSGSPAALLNVGGDGSISLPAGLDADLGSISLFTVTGTSESGLWELGARVLDPVTGAVYSYDPASFRIAATVSDPR